VTKSPNAFTRKLHTGGLGNRLTIEDRANRIGVVRTMAYTACGSVAKTGCNAGRGVMSAPYAAP
jgi:hypothetical protein